ncbi:MAG: hypothetical protein OXC02_03480 [Rhodobacteraceae bacterium]|nr:hypothetical protein [Paracoccaceae bacterium]
MLDQSNQIRNHQRRFTTHDPLTGENSRHGQSVKPMTLPLTTTRFACADNTTLHLRTTATPDAIQTKIYQNMELSPQLMNGRKVSGLT